MGMASAGVGKSDLTVQIRPVVVGMLDEQLAVREDAEPAAGRLDGQTVRSAVLPLDRKSGV